MLPELFPQATILLASEDGAGSYIVANLADVFDFTPLIVAIGRLLSITHIAQYLITLKTSANCEPNRWLFTHHQSPFRWCYVDHDSVDV